MTKPAIALDYGKIPPQALDIEEVFLGALLLDGKAFEDVKTMLPAEAFYKESHQLIYSAMREINFKGGEIDILTVTEKLRAMEKLENVGGAAYISQLTSRVASAAHIKHHLAIIYDKWVARECIRIGSELVDQAFAEADDILDTLQETRNAMDKRLLQYLGINSTGISIVDAGNESLNQYYKRELMYKENQRSGIPSTFRSLDKFTAGWQKEHLIVLAARPGMGKTSMAISFMMTAAAHEKSAAFFSLEMSSTKLMDKVNCNIADVNLQDFKKGRLFDHDKEKIEQAGGIYENWNVTFNDDLLTTMEQITASATVIKSRKGLDLVIIDYLQLMTSRDKQSNREREVAENSRKAKMLAVELDCTVILLSQLNRGLESRADKRPMLSDLRESGAIEQDADIVLFIYREGLYNTEMENGQGELIIAKHREGPTGTLDFNYNETLTKFWDPREASDGYNIDQMSPEGKEFEIKPF